MPSEAAANLGVVTWYELVITVSIGWFVLAGIAGIAIGKRLVWHVRDEGPVEDGWGDKRPDVSVPRSSLTAPGRPVRGGTYVERSLPRPR